MTTENGFYISVHMCPYICLLPGVTANCSPPNYNIISRSHCSALSQFLCIVPIILYFYNLVARSEKNDLIFYYRNKMKKYQHKYAVCGENNKISYGLQSLEGMGICSGEQLKAVDTFCMQLLCRSMCLCGCKP